MSKKFINLLMDGEAILEDIDDYISEWHRKPQKTSLCQFLGLTDEEYAYFVASEDNLRLIVAARVNQHPLQELVKSKVDSPRFAARGVREAATIKQILKNHKK
jgi:hypothetical protein